MKEQFEMVAKTFQGLEDVLAEELRGLGAENVEPGRRMVSFEGDLEMLTAPPGPAATPQVSSAFWSLPSKIFSKFRWQILSKRDGSIWTKCPFGTHLALTFYVIYAIIFACSFIN